MASAGKSEFCTISDLRTKRDDGAYANTAKDNMAATSDYVGYEALNVSLENTNKAEEVTGKMRAEIATIVTTIRRLKVVCFVQLVFLLITVTVFAIFVAKLMNNPYEPERKPTAGDWSDWSHWTSCSTSCGTGLKQRQRNCTSMKQESSSKICEGVSFAQQLCETRLCPINGNWSEWTNWSSCSASCGLGKMHRVRFCSNPSPLYGGLDCSGQRVEETACSLVSCFEPRSAFTVFGPQNGPSPGTLKFMNITTNIGRHYNESTGKYVCEYTGIYVFTLHLYKYPANFDYVECYIRKNAIEQIKVFNNPDADSDIGHYEATGSAILHLIPGDIVDLGASTSISAMDSWTSFSGFLLAAD